MLLKIVFLYFFKEERIKWKQKEKKRKEMI